MRFWFLILAVIVLTGSGCSKLKHRSAKTPGKASPPAATAEKKPVVTPAPTPSGTVSMVNRAAGFAVLTFTSGQLPARGEKLNVYRGGLKIGELRVTGPEQDINTVADKIAGDVQANDEVRAD